jgi:membrane carboxypeptidase/penicillin-binding protein
MGMTTNLVTGVWVGGDDRSIHFRTGAYGEGSKTAMPLYRRFMLKVKGDPDLKQYHPVPFEKLDQRNLPNSLTVLETGGEKVVLAMIVLPFLQTLWVEVLVVVSK